MAYEEFSDTLLDGYKKMIKIGKVDPFNYDLQDKDSKKRYQDYISKIVALKPKEYFTDSFSKLEKGLFLNIAASIVVEIFGEGALEDFIIVVREKLCISNSKIILEGITLSATDLNTGKKMGEIIQIPDLSTITSIIALIHEFTHYYLDKVGMDYNKKQYYREVLTIYVEKRVMQILSLYYPEERLIRVEETRLESIVWHYRDKKLDFNQFVNFYAQKKRKSSIDFEARMIVLDIEKRFPWLKDPQLLGLKKQYDSNISDSYGIGYLYAESLICKFRDSVKAGERIKATLNGKYTLQGTLDYFGIDASSDEVYDNVEQKLQLVKRERKK